jgi:hypothetical protein
VVTNKIFVLDDLNMLKIRWSLQEIGIGLKPVNLKTDLEKDLIEGVLSCD